MARSNRLWGFDEEERRLLLDATAGISALQALVTGAEHRPDLGLWLVRASVGQLDEMYSLVEALMDGTRSRKRLDVLEGLRATLCNAMDGF